MPGPGGDIAVGEGSVWVTAFEYPLSRIDPSTNTVVQQFAEKGDAIRVGLGSVWLSNLEAGNIWRIDPRRVLADPARIIASASGYRNAHLRFSVPELRERVRRACTAAASTDRLSGLQRRRPRETAVWIRGHSRASVPPTHSTRASARSARTRTRSWRTRNTGKSTRDTKETKDAKARGGKRKGRHAFPRSGPNLEPRT